MKRRCYFGSLLQGTVHFGVKGTEAGGAGHTAPSQEVGMHAGTQLPLIKTRTPSPWGGASHIQSGSFYFLPNVETLSDMPNSLSPRLLEATPIQYFLRGHDGRTTETLVPCSCLGADLARAGLGLGQGFEKVKVSVSGNLAFPSRGL